MSAESKADADEFPTQHSLLSTQHFSQFRGLESNQHPRVQSPPSYRLDDPGVAEEGIEPSRLLAAAFETTASTGSATRPK